MLSSLLGEARLRSLLHLGQSRTIDKLFTSVALEKQHRVLDCGAGHGGTALVLAGGAEQTVVDALTLSEEQARLIARNAISDGHADRVRPIVANVFDLPDGMGPYDLIYGIESFCQMGEPNSLYAVLRALQPRGGILAVSDNFVSNNSRVKDRFDRYWMSDVTSLIDTVSSLEHAGYRLIDLADITAAQIPFWQLSIALTAIRLGDSDTQRAPSTERLGASQSFHEDLAAAFTSGDLRYVQFLAIAV